MAPKTKCCIATYTEAEPVAQLNRQSSGTHSNRCGASKIEQGSVYDPNVQIQNSRPLTFQTFSSERHHPQHHHHHHHFPFLSMRNVRERRLARLKGKSSGPGNPAVGLASSSSSSSPRPSPSSSPVFQSNMRTNIDGGLACNTIEQLTTVVIKHRHYRC